MHAAEFTNMAGWWLGSVQGGGTAWRERRREWRLARPFIYCKGLYYIARVSTVELELNWNSI
jgi:hypothetical protein